MISWIVATGILVLPLFMRREAWPFSSYPMFSERLAPSAVRVDRIAIEWPDGSRTWWTPLCHRLPQRFARRHAGAAAGIQKLEVARQIRRVVEASGGAYPVAAICFVERSVARDAPPWEITEKLSARYPRAILSEHS